jgi:hypothetical protein
MGLQNVLSAFLWEPFIAAESGGIPHYPIC